MRAWTIAWTSLRRTARDRATLFFTLALPVVIILVIGLATSGLDQSAVPVGIVAPPGELADALIERIGASEAVDVLRFDDPSALRRAVRRSVVGAGVVVPRAYDERLRTGDEVEVGFVLDPTRGFPTAVRAVVGAAVSEQGGVLQAARFATEEAGGSIEENLSLARGIALRTPPVTVSVDEVEIEEGAEVSFGTGFVYQAPANLVLFVFITSLAGSAALIEERRLGLTRRILASPASPRTVLAGIALGRFLLAATQALFIYLVGLLIFGVDWGDPVAAALLIGVFVLVGTGVGMLFGTVFSTPEQAGAIGAPVGIALGMLGGCMWPLEVVPDGMAAFGHLFPHAWAMDAWIDITAFGRGVGGVALELAVLAGYAVVLMGLATRRLRRTLGTP